LVFDKEDIRFAILQDIPTLFDLENGVLTKDNIEDGNILLVDNHCFIVACVVEETTGNIYAVAGNYIEYNAGVLTIKSFDVQRCNLSIEVNRYVEGEKRDNTTNTEAAYRDFIPGIVRIDGEYVQEKAVGVNETITLSAIPNEGYVFTGWYSAAGTLLSTSQYYDISISSDTHLEARFTAIIYTVTYVLLEKECFGLGSEEEFELFKQEYVIDESSLVYDETVISFTVEDNLVGRPSLGGFTFEYWTVEYKNPDTGLFEIDRLQRQIVDYELNRDYNEDGSTLYRDIRLTAHWKPGDESTLTYEVKYYVVNPLTNEPELLTTQDIESNMIFNNPFFRGYNFEMLNGLYIDDWYTDIGMLNKYAMFGKTPIGNIDLYGQWQYISSRGFYNYFDKFETARENGEIEIESIEELCAFIEYVEYFRIRADIKIITVNSGTNTYMSRIPSDFDEALNASKFLGEKGKKYTYSGYMLYKYTSAYQDPTSESYNSTKAYNQLDYILTQTYNTGLIYNGYGSAIDITNSNQLAYALMHGYNVSWTGNALFDKAKQIVNQICSDSMTEFERARAVYEWVVNNVRYDYAMSSVSGSRYIYQGLYLEGALVNYLASAEGIAKTMVVLGSLAGLSTIIVTDGGGHYWNKVYVDNNWYVIDASIGSYVIYTASASTCETISYETFMISDARFEEIYGYTISEMSKFSDSIFGANTEINQYANIKFIDSENGDVEISLYISSISELNKLIDYINSKLTFVSGTSSITFAFEFAAATSLGDLSSELLDGIKYVDESAGNNDTFTTIVDGYERYTSNITSGATKVNSYTHSVAITITRN